MKYTYLVITFLLSMLSQQVRGQGTLWRPFRPGLVYHFQSAGADSLFTLRVDSAYTIGSDSAYRFNRVLRPIQGRYVKSPNNLFGAYLLLKRATREFTLQMQAEAAITQYPSSPAIAAQTVNLRPQAPIGSSWPLSPTTTATLTARTLRTLDGTADSVATITCSDGRVFEISKRLGLVTAPRGLGTAAPAFVMHLHKSPQLQAYYQQPKDIYDFQPSDELGYFMQPTQIVPCFDNRRLLRVVSRQQTADSIIYYTQQQLSNVTYGPPYQPFCPGPYQQTFYPAYQRRLAYALRPTRPTSSFGETLGLLTYEYTPISSSTTVMLPTKQVTICSIARYQVSTTILFYQGTAYLNPDPDFLIAGQYATGMGMTKSGYETLNYYLKHSSTGSASSCGTSGYYTGLLPSRAAQAAAAATLHPNPATDAATLTLVAPTQPGSVLTLTDALGRRVWSTELTPGQTTLAVPLAGQAPGLYLLQLLTTNAAPLTWKLHKQ